MSQTNETRLSSGNVGLKRRGRLLASVLAVPFLAALPAQLARAQFPANNGNGHANDANNQVGSGGYNQANRSAAGVTPGDIVYGNVTGLSRFQGRLDTTDPTAFRATTFTYSADQFIGQSNAAPVRGTPSVSTNGYSTTPYFSDARGVAPPPNYVPVVGGGGYVPTTSSQASVYSYQLPDAALGGSFRTGAGLGSGSLDPNLNPLMGINGSYAPYGTDFRLGPTEPGSDQSLLFVSPLSGIQQGQLNNASDSYYLSRTQLLRLQGGGRFQRLDQQTLDQMRREAQEQPQGPEGQAQPQNPNELGGKMPQPLEAPVNKPLDSSLGSQLSLPQPLNSALGTQEGMYRTLTTAAQQTPVLNELQQRLEQYKQHAPAAVEKEQQFEAAQKAANARQAAAKPGQPAGTQVPGLPATPVRPGPGASGVPSVTLTPGGASKPDIGALAGGSRTEPVHITSLAEGVRAKGLAGLLKAAEDMMKQGKFTSAIDQYSLAEQVAPNNPLIPLGQANAELGAASYRDAELHLRRAFASDLALLHAQFDLNSVIGQRRVHTLMDDLKDLAEKDPKAEMPAFLLAYMNYNTGHEAEAIKYLTDVEKREGRPDPVVARMLQHWYVPSTTKPAVPELNK